MLIETEKRLIDANLNRLREGIRVLEDIARYILNDLPLSSALKELRHKARVAHSTNLLQYRDIKNDILKTSTPSEKRRENLRDIVVANFKRSEESARVLEEIFKLDSAQSAESNKKESCEAPLISPASWCKKSESKGAEVPPADFLLEAEKRGSPPKSEKRQLLARRGSGEGGAALLREKTNKIDGEIGAESTLDSTNQRQSTKSLCEIFKAIRYDLYDIEIAYFRAIENIENKDEK